MYLKLNKEGSIDYKFMEGFARHYNGEVIAISNSKIRFLPGTLALFFILKYGQVSSSH